MKVDLVGKPAFLSDVRYGDLFYTQFERAIFPCIKSFLVMNDAEILDYAVTFMPSDRDRTYLPRLLEEKGLQNKTVYCVADTSFRPLISEATMLMDIGYWPKPGDVIESPEATYLTIKSGRMPHKLIYLNVATGELVTTPPRAPFTFVTDWKITLDQPQGEQTLIQFPLGSPVLLRNAVVQ